MRCPEIGNTSGEQNCSRLSNNGSVESLCPYDPKMECNYFSTDGILAMPGLVTNGYLPSVAGYLENDSSNRRSLHPCLSSDESYDTSHLARCDFNSLSNSTTAAPCQNEGKSVVDKLQDEADCVSPNEFFCSGNGTTTGINRNASSCANEFNVNISVISSANPEAELNLALTDMSPMPSEHSHELDPGILVDPKLASDDYHIYTSEENGGTFQAAVPLHRNENAFNNLTTLDNTVKTGPALVLEVPKLSASRITQNNNKVLLDGFNYSSNLPSLISDSSHLKVPPSVPEMNRVFVKGGKDITIGSKIQAPGDLIMNQYVDFNGGLLDHSAIIVSDSTPPDNCCIRHKYCWVAVILAMFAIGAVGVATTLLQVSQEAEVADPDGLAPANYTMRLVGRGQWSYHTDAVFSDLKINPPKNIIVCHSADSFCSSREICENRVRSIESFHVQIGFTSIGYNFLIGGDGLIYEGRGWGKWGSYSVGFNCNSIGVGFIGNFDLDELTPVMVDAYEVLIDEGLRRGALDPNYKLFAHNQVKKGASSSPGLAIIQAMKSWPHFTLQVTDDDRCS